MKLEVEVSPSAATRQEPASCRVDAPSQRPRFYLENTGKLLVKR